MLKAADYEVAAVASSANLQYCRDIGADYVFDYKSTDGTNDVVTKVKGKVFTRVFCPTMSADTIGTCAQIAAQLGDNTGTRCRIRTSFRME
jgi:NADPH:quinone reductase-like Zn-dependent oxidoreductase